MKVLVICILLIWSSELFADRYEIGKDINLNLRQLTKCGEMVDQVAKEKIKVKDKIATDDLEVLTIAFNRLADDEQLTIESLQNFRAAWVKSSGKTKLKIWSLPRFDEINRRLSLKFQAIYGRKIECTKEYRKLLRVVFRSFSNVKEKKEN